LYSFSLLTKKGAKAPKPGSLASRLEVIFDELPPCRELYQMRLIEARI